MKKSTSIIILACILFFSCKTKTTSLSDQLKTSLELHLKTIDSLAIIDSVHIIHNIPLTEKVGRIVDDSAYSMEIRDAKAKLSVAKGNNDIGEVERYQDELNYMNKVVDSVEKSISSSDTTLKYGYVVVVSYSITKNKKTKIDSTVFFIDSAYNIMHPSIIDMSLQKALKN
jgi:hypothetical protein